MFVGGTGGEWSPGGGKQKVEQVVTLVRYSLVPTKRRGGVVWGGERGKGVGREWGREGGGEEGYVCR